MKQIPVINFYMHKYRNDFYYTEGIDDLLCNVLKLMLKTGRIYVILDSNYFMFEK